MEAFGRAVCVTVDGTRQILDDVDWRITAEDVIRRLKPSSGPQMLVESWRGCIRRIDKDEHILQLLEEWGEEARSVDLVIMSSHSLPGYRPTKRRLDKAKIYKAQRHGKVASNKRRCLSRLATPKRDTGKEVARLIARAEVARERLAAVEELGASHCADSTLLELESASFELSPSEEEEWVALQEQLTEEEQEKRELEERRKEIREKIDTQREEITTFKRRNEELQKKLLQEKDKQGRLSSGEKSKELEEAETQVKHLQNELRVRMKLNPPK